MHTIKVQNIEVSDAIDLKNQLLQDGLIINQDFEWVWIPSQWDAFSGWTNQHKHALFTFHEQALATFYQLKWTR